MAQKRHQESATTLGQGGTKPAPKANGNETQANNRTEGMKRGRREKRRRRGRKGQKQEKQKGQRRLKVEKGQTRETTGAGDTS